MRAAQGVKTSGSFHLSLLIRSKPAAASMRRSF